MNNIINKVNELMELLFNIDELGHCDKCKQLYILYDIAEIKHKAILLTKEIKQLLGGS